MTEAPPRSARAIVVVAVSAGLVLTLVGLCVTVALGRQVPDELWVATSALIGALVGTLIPTPARAAAQAYVIRATRATKKAANQAARETAGRIANDPNQPTDSKKAAEAALIEVQAVTLPVRARAREIFRPETAGQSVDKLVDRYRSEAGYAARQAESYSPRATTAAPSEQYGYNRTRVEVHEAAAQEAEHEALRQLESADPKVVSARPGVRRWPFVVGVGTLLLVVLALLIAAGSIHARGCPLEVRGVTEACDSGVLQIGTTFLAVAAGIAGVLLGMLASAGTEPAARDASAT